MYGGISSRSLADGTEYVRVQLDGRAVDVLTLPRGGGLSLSVQGTSGSMAVTIRRDELPEFIGFLLRVLDAAEVQAAERAHGYAVESEAA